MIVALLVGLAVLVAWRRTRTGVAALSAATAFVAIPAGRAVDRLTAHRRAVAELTAPGVREPDCVHEPGVSIPRLDPDGCLVLGTRADGTAAAIDPAEAGGLALSGPGGDDVARALMVALTVQSPGWDVQVVIPRADLARLLGVDQADLACGAIPGLVVTTTLAEALFHLRVETMRGCHFDDLPALGVDRPRLILIAAPDDDVGCPRGTLSNYGAGIGVILLGSLPHAVSCRVDASGTVTSTDGPARRMLTGAHLSTLTVAEARTRMYEWAIPGQPGSPPELTGPRPRPTDAGTATAVLSEPQAADTQRHRAGRGPAVPWAPRTRLYVRVLGPTTVEVDGRPVAVRMRGDAWDLLAILGVFRAGITDEAIADHLWPGDSATRQHQHLSTAVKTLNKTLREVGGLGRDVRFAIKTQRRHLAAALVDVDLWRVQDALAAAADHDGSQALRLAVEAAGGPLLPDDEHAWTEAYRYDVNRQIIDAAVRLADTEAATDPDPDLALHHLNQVIDHVDPLAEDLYRQAMDIQAGLGRIDAAHRTFQTLTARLACNGMEPAWETVDLHQRLRGRQ